MPPETFGQEAPPPAPAWVRRAMHRLHLPSDWYIIAIGAVVGGLTAFGAVGFALALEWLEHSTGELREHWSIWLLPVIPVIGALITGLLVHYGAREAKGHGVPQVIDALSRKKGVIPGRVGIIKVLASISTVGTGGSAGAEGPIVQIGSTAGSVFGRMIGIGREHQSTLVGCGAAAGIASVFNAPIAGVFFVLEILLRDFSLKTFTPVVFASVFSASVTQVLLGQNDAIFAVELPEYAFTIPELPLYAILGLACAAVSVGFTWLLHKGEDVFEKIRIHPILRPTLGGLGLGLLGLVFLMLLRTDSHTPGFFGNGYATIRSLLDPMSYDGAGTPGPIHGVLDSEGLPGLGGALTATIPLVLALLICKALGTVLTLASGGSGGVFAPSLFLGATCGAVIGASLETLGLLPGGASPASYALVGMAAVVSGTTFAPLTAILLIFELTQEPRVLLPVMLGSIVATIVARVWMRDSIYTMRLRQAGVLLSAGRDLTVMRRVPVASCEMGPLPPEPVHASDPLAKLITLHANHNVPDFVVTDPETGGYMGLVPGSDIRTALIDREAIPLLLVAELLRTDLPTVSRDETLDTVLDKFAEHDIASLCVVSPIDATLPIGVITRREVLKRYRQALEEG